MTLLATVLVLALTRAEIIARMKAPVITQCEGLVQVYADCAEDQRKEYQMPVASFAADTVRMLQRGLALKPRRFDRPNILVHVGDVRTNDVSVLVRVVTNETRIVTRLFLPSPGSSDLAKFRLELVKAFSRSVLGVERDDAAAWDLVRRSDPDFRLNEERGKLKDWLAGKLPSPTPEDDEANLARVRKVLRPGVSSVDDLRIFASRLYLYPATLDQPFCGKYPLLSFRDAVAVRTNAFVRLAALNKATPLLVFGGGRSPAQTEAARLYYGFLLELAKGEVDEKTLLDLLDAADTKLNVAYEEARR